MSYTISRIQSEMTAAGSHWWDRDSMRFFKTRVAEQVYQGPGGIYFVTSEKGPSENRLYSVRQYRPADKSIDTIGEFNSLSRARAHRNAAELASKDLQTQFVEAMAALDSAMPNAGQCEPRYGTIEEARESASMTLSSDCQVKATKYTDSSGYYLERDEITPEAWNAAYKLKQEVCRVLATEPAGDSATVTKDAYRKPSAAAQLATDMQRGGALENIVAADWLIRLATQHHKMMEDSCSVPNADVFDDEGDPRPRLAELRALITEVATNHGCAGVIFSGDPRGATVKLVLPSGATNDWGKEGWCVPTRE